jgi:hypothetical protein
MHDELRAGIDRPRGRQYVILVLIITLVAIVAYFYRRSGPPLRLQEEPAPSAVSQLSRASWVRGVVPAVVTTCRDTAGNTVT